MGEKIENAVNSAALLISGFCFSGMIMSIAVNVICRYFFNLSFDWAEEIAYLFFNWAVFLGATVIFRNQEMVAIDIVVNRLPQGARRAAMIINYALILAITLALVVWGFRFAMNAWIRKSTALGISYFFYDMSIPLSSLILAGYALKYLVMTLKGEEIKQVPVEERL
ncbi:MAG: TRAP transporter small permease [Spirochaetales bacterium]|nr:TRAP transporter small permease [Spirochaetales bacterium]